MLFSLPHLLSTINQLTVMNITKEQVEELLPQTVKDTDVLTEDAKNVFAVLLNSLLVSKGAEDTGVLVMPTDRLKSCIGWGIERIMKAIWELERYELITRIPGKPRTSGEKATATKYIFHWEVIDKPIERKTHNDLFAKFKKMKNSGTPFQDCNGNMNGNINSNINNNTNINANSNENSNDNKNSNLNSKSKCIEEQEFEMNKFVVEGYIEQETKGKTYSEITRLTIPIHNWIDSQFPKYSDRLKRIADNRLYKIKREGLSTEDSSTLVIDEYQACQPF